ncbi:MAG TPA: hypothetical protein VIP11_23470 [Gemmatimonadaceae bacterium]
MRLLPAPGHRRTDLRQTGVTPGTLVREWAENGRRYFHYRTDAPIRYGGTVLSAEYAVRRDTAHGVKLSVYYHPTHDVNVDRMMRSLRASLAYYGEQFGPYQYKELRIVEFPRYASFARAQYSSMMVLETTYGEQMAREFYDYNIQKYFQGRSAYTNREAPGSDAPPPTSHRAVRGAESGHARLAEGAVVGPLRAHHDLGCSHRFSEGRAGPGRGIPRDAVRRRVEGARRQHRQLDANRDGRPRGDWRLRRKRERRLAGRVALPEAAPHPRRKAAIVITVPRQPTRAGIDPYRNLIERERDDNVGEIETSPPPK